MSPEAASVLVVDDTPANVRLLDGILSPRGYAVVTAASGPEALRQARQARPDIVLLDVLMPDMDGYEVCRCLRDEADSPALPIIMITASAEEAKVRAIEAGADDFVVKPIAQDELLARIRALLQAKQRHDLARTRADELAAVNVALASDLEAARAAIVRLHEQLAARNEALSELVERLLAAAPTRSGGDERGRAEAELAALRLTPREHEVLRLLARGRSNAEIAADLVVSVATVKSHVEHVIAKLGIPNRTQAALRAIELGLAEPS